MPGADNHPHHLAEKLQKIGLKVSDANLFIQPLLLKISLIIFLTFCPIVSQFYFFPRVQQKFS